MSTPETRNPRRDEAHLEALSTNTMLITMAGGLAFFLACLSVLAS